MASQRDNLEKDIAISEEQAEPSAAWRAANKATGPDGIPAEFYTQFEYLLLERLHAVLTEAAVL